MPNWKKLIVSGSDASLNSLNVSNNVGITGSLTVLNNALLGDSAAGYVIDTNTGTWLGGTPTTGLDVASGVLYDLNGNASIEWQNRSLVDVDSNTVLTWSTSSNNGVRLYGTASYALTASYVNPLNQNVTITGSILMSGSITDAYISTVNWIDFNPNLPSGNPAFNTGRLHWVDDTKTLGLDTDVNGSTIELGHQQVVRVVNLTGTTISKGRVVYITGSQGTRPGIATASYTDENDSATTLGLVMHDILGSGPTTGYVVTRGLIRDVNTTGLTAGTSLYLSSSGQYSTSKPQAPLHEVRLGKVIVGNSAAAGVIYVDIQNGFELEELHDVRIVSSSNGDLITKSGSLWINTKQLSGSYGLTGSISFTGGGITGSVFGTATTASFVTGSIFSGTNQVLSASYALSASHVIGGASTINIQEEGSGIGSAGTINFTGAGVTATFGGGTATVNIPGGGSATAGGANTTIQFNDSTVLSGSGNFTFNKSTNRVELTGSLGVSAGVTGSLFGTASWSTLTTSASVSSSNSAGSNYLLFAETTVGNTPLRTDGALSYVPDTNTLSTHTVDVSDKLTILKALYATRGLGGSNTGTTVVNDATFHILCDTQTGTVDVDLRNSEGTGYNGRILVIKDYSYNAATNNITFLTGGSIENGSGYTMAINGESVIIVYDETFNTWWVIAKFTP